MQLSASNNIPKITLERKIAKTKIIIPTYKALRIATSESAVKNVITAPIIAGIIPHIIIP